MTYQTPRMLARTLKTLRSRKGLNGEQLGKCIGRSKSAVSAYETRQDSVTYEVLDLYQFYFGAPNGIILSISHVAAMARDASAADDPATRRRERQKLKLMGRYLRNLSDRILSPNDLGKLPLSSHKHIKVAGPQSWDDLLADLFDSTQRGIAANSNTLFEDPPRLRRMRRARTTGAPERRIPKRRSQIQ